MSIVAIPYTTAAAPNGQARVNHYHNFFGDLANIVPGHTNVQSQHERLVFACASVGRMRHRCSLRQLVLGLSVLAVASLAVCCQCQREGNASNPPEAAWSATSPIQIADSSLPNEQYIALGLAAHDRNWSSEDLREASAHLRALTTTKPASLPRYASERSGKIFARMTSSDNLAVLRNPLAPVSIRLPAALLYMHELNGIYQLYVTALQNRTVTGEDLVKLHGARLRACRVLLELAGEYSPTLATSDPKYQTRIEGIEAMRSATSDVMLAAVRALSDPLVYGLPARKRLVGSCRETFPAIAPRLAVASRDELVLELKAAAARPNLSNLLPELGMLQLDVTRTVASTSERDAS
jgi:hypothetical protein